MRLMELLRLITSTLHLLTAILFTALCALKFMTGVQEMKTLAFCVTYVWRVLGKQNSVVASSAFIIVRLLLLFYCIPFAALFIVGQQTTTSLVDIMVWT